MPAEDFWKSPRKGETHFLSGEYRTSLPQGVNTGVLLGKREKTTREGKKEF